MSKKNKLILAVSIIVIVTLFLLVKVLQKNASNQKLKPVKPFRGDITLTVSTIGMVKPQNRLEIKPPISGRIEKILVKEGEEVKVGDILALMSSMERATLIDAARLKGEAEYKHWQKLYKETPLIAPIDGIVIVRDVEPGQTVSTSDPVLVLSNRLIVEADVDETDIGGIKVGQRAIIGLDAYPDIKIDAVVDHISYESQIVSNVTIYKVDVLPKVIPDVFRSGMSANVEIVVDEVKDALLIPADSLMQEGKKTLAMVKNRNETEPHKKEIVVGMENEGVVQVKSGISEGDMVYVPERSFVIPKKKNGETPFLPSFRGREEKKNK